MRSWGCEKGRHGLVSLFFSEFGQGHEVQVAFQFVEAYNEGSRFDFPFWYHLSLVRPSELEELGWWGRTAQS